MSSQPITSTGLAVTIRDVGARLPRRERRRRRGAGRLQPGDRRWFVHRDHRSERLREEHAAAADCGPAAANGRHRPGGWPAATARRRAGRIGLPAAPAHSVAHDPRQRGAAPRARGRTRGGAARTRDRRARPCRAARCRDAQAAGAVGRHGAARGACAGAHRRPSRPPAGRAVQRARRADARDVRQRGAAAVARAPAHGGLRHPQRDARRSRSPTGWW